jgi:hypothetical protein
MVVLVPVTDGMARIRSSASAPPPGHFSADDRRRLDAPHRRPRDRRARRLSVAAISTRSAIALVWLIVFGSMVAFTAYTYANNSLPNETVATYAYVNPVVAVLLGALVDREPITLNILLGGAVIVASVVVIVRSRATRGH